MSAFVLQDFRVGDRVELHPRTDRWMAGDRFGEITSVGRTYVHVRFDRSGAVKRVAPENIGQIVSRGER